MADGWFARHIPTRETLGRNRFLKPFAGRLLRSDLWRFNRRSVPRGMALGLFVGVMIPGAHFIVAAFVATFVRANIPVALAATFIGFPAIYLILVALARTLGNWLLNLDAGTKIQPINEAIHATQTGDLLQRLTGEVLTTAFGLFVIATVLASVGYLATSFGWRLWIGRKRRQRLAAAKAVRHRQAASRAAEAPA